MVEKDNFPNYPKNTEEEDKEFSMAFDEAIAVMALKDRRKAIEEEIQRLESYAPSTPKETLEKIKSIEAKKQELKKLTEPNRLNQRHKLKVRKIAEKIWQNHPDMTIQELIMGDEINASTTPRVYTEKTLRNWIKDLAPNRRPGRRTKRR